MTEEYINYKQYKPVPVKKFGNHRFVLYGSTTSWKQFNKWTEKLRQDKYLVRRVAVQEEPTRFYLWYRSRSFEWTANGARPIPKKYRGDK